MLGCGCLKRPLAGVLGPCRAVRTLVELVGPLTGLSSQNQKVPDLSGWYRTLPSCLALAEFIGSLPDLSSQNQKVPGLSGRYRTLPSCLGPGRVYRATTGLTEPESESSGLIGPISDFADRWAAPDCIGACRLALEPFRSLYRVFLRLHAVPGIFRKTSCGFVSLTRK